MRPEARIFADRYRLESVTQADEYGEAWLGTDLALARQVTIKFAADADGLRVKAHMTGSITHAGIVRVYDFDLGPPPFLVTEFVDGSRLARVLADGPMTATWVADFVTQSARALSAAHAAGITHGGLDAWDVLVDRAGTRRSARARAAGPSVPGTRRPDPRRRVRPGRLAHRH